MLSKYKTYPLGNFIEQIRGVSYKKSDVSEVPKEGYIPLLRANNIQAGKLVFSDVIYVKKELVRDSQLIKKGDIVIAASSGSKEVVGKSGQAHSDYDCSFGAFCKLIRAKENINPRFLGYFFKTDYYSSSISNSVNGANINNLRNEHIDNLLIPIPSVSTQEKIANVLDKAQELIDKRKAQIEALDQLTQSVFLEVFGDPATNPKKWPMGFIKDLALKTQYGTSKKASEDTGKYPILRMNNITYEGHWDLTDLKYVDLDDKEVEKYLVHKGELLFNRTNSKELVGKTAVYRFEKPMAFAGYLVKLIPNEKANAEFISAYLNSKYGKSILFSMAKNIVGMANINAEELKSIKIYIPPKQLQDQFAEIVQKIESQRELFKKGLVELEKNFNSLMQRVFKGELFNDKCM